jgi:hypothetical protein
MQSEVKSPPPLSVSFPEGIINGRHRYSVIEDDAPRTAPLIRGAGWAVSWSLAIGLWIEQHWAVLETGAVVATVAGWVGVVAWLSLNLVGGPQ